MNILLVDDEMLELEQLEYLIKNQFPKWTIYKANDASQAVQINKQHNISLAFLDIQLPGKSGLELASELAQNYTMDIIMVTAFQSFEYAQKSIRLGVVDYITKPVIEDELIGVLNKYEQLGQYSESIIQTIQIIQQEYSEKITLNYLASKSHMNPAYLSRKFHEEVGLGFSEYLNDYRLNIAKKMLIEQPTLSIHTVSEKCGFNSQHYFSQMFRKLTGMTPREFRLEVPYR
ncbi:MULTISPECIES: response regulator transcription factor [Cytobacillus]|uniref:DNA-binding response regulator n=1 Tax=Cytobacillus kochii TaxID=859143 RepID=A0A248TFZ2_9BACI|nr:helix-turn-helix domain-containing protein [Cytobacillus kochii]ASV67020.1 DNA-binding response regulator [Cytobacillus kochii]MCA1029292.1 helix-turn-helix domain-containing protein [Cytobacillus kochii]MCM3323583.1 helix-turn-helix domain-containing protein [Cytobacillus kochii]MCM3345978.1 helix-turn-helix domain-containing protein [Cytobacillus kochii]